MHVTYTFVKNIKDSHIFLVWRVVQNFSNNFKQDFKNLFDIKITHLFIVVTMNDMVNISNISNQD